MSKFEDMMNSELPSKRRGLFTEMYEDSDDFGMSDSDMEKYMEQECGDSYDEGYCVGGSCDEDSDYDDFDDDEEEDEEEFMNKLDNLVNDDDEDDDFDDDDDDHLDGDAQISDNEEIKDGDLDLGPDGEQRVRDAIDSIATPLILAEEFTESELEAFLESADCDIAINEGYLTEKSIIKLDKNAKKARAYEVAVMKIARENNDNLMKKLDYLWATERRLKSLLRRKYNSYATRFANDYIRRIASSASKKLSQIGNKLKSAFTPKRRSLG